MLFQIRPGRYVVPGIGRVDANKEVAPEVALKLYESRAFPWCDPVIKKETVDFIKKQKPEPKRIASLIQAAKSPEEVDFLLEIKSNNTLKNIAETKKASFDEAPAV